MCPLLRLLRAHPSTVVTRVRPAKGMAGWAAQHPVVTPQAAVTAIVMARCVVGVRLATVPCLAPRLAAKPRTVVLPTFRGLWLVYRWLLYASRRMRWCWHVARCTRPRRPLPPQLLSHLPQPRRCWHPLECGRMEVRVTCSGCVALCVVLCAQCYCDHRHIRVRYWPWRCCTCILRYTTSKRQCLGMGTATRACGLCAVLCADGSSCRRVLGHRLEHRAVVVAAHAGHGAASFVIARWWPPVTFRFRS